MIGIVRRELKELLPLIVLLAVAAVVLAFVFWGEHERPNGPLIAAAAMGILAGAACGELDRLRKRDAFHHHRAVSPVAREVARILTGFAVLVVPLLLMFGIIAAMPYRNGPLVWPGFRGLTFVPVVLIILLSLSVASAVRLGVGVRNPLGAVIASAALGIAVISWFVRSGTVGGAVFFVLLSTSAFSAASVLGMLRPGLSRRGEWLRAAALLVACGILLTDVATWGRLAGFAIDHETRGGGVQIPQTKDLPVGMRRSVSLEDLVELSPQMRFWGKGEVPRFFYPAEDPFATGEGIAEIISTDWPMQLRAPQFTYEAGRFVAGDLGGFGPDGWRSGPAGSDGDRFEKPSLLAWGWLDGVDPDSRQAEPRGYRVAIADTARQEVVVLEFSPAARDSALFVPSRRVRLAGERHERLAVTEKYALAFHSAGASVTRPLRLDDEIIGLSREGEEIGRLPAKSDEEFFYFSPHLTGDKVSAQALVSVRLPLDPVAPALRFRTFRRGEDPIATESRVRPHAGLETVVSWAAQAPLLLQPPVLNAASVVGPAPKSIRGYFGRSLGDPLFSGGRHGGWLLASLLTGVLCAALSWLAVRYRLPKGRARTLWVVSGFLLGPLGLLWLVTVLPREHIAVCGCGRKRAVSIGSCPGCRAEWPGPKPTGAEVLIPL